MKKIIPNHEITYDYSSIRNYVHRYRLSILSNICSKHFIQKGTYADFGCSNGFVTDKIIKDNSFKSIVGYDFIDELIDEGNKRFNFNIKFLNLNAGNSPGLYDNVSCFETLEHTVNLYNSIKTIVNSIKPNGRGVISVPIEVGLIGLFKFLIKTLIYQYSLEELSKEKIYFKYLKCLLTNKKISIFREINENKEWSSHFGFDYRDVNENLNLLNIDFKMITRGTTAIFLIYK